MSEQHNGQVSTLQRPTTNKQEDWKTYWKQQGLPWRTEPEIVIERQKYLTEHRIIVPDMEKGIYPFKGVELDRADIEWLLATHENGRGPIDWTDKSQRKRKGLDLRGADLRGQDLSRMPLACLRGGLNWNEWLDVTGQSAVLNPINRIDPSYEHYEMAAILLERANLREAHLEDAELDRAHLEKTILVKAQLKRVSLHAARLREANLDGAQLRGANLQAAQLQNATLRRTKLWKAHFNLSQLQGAILYATKLQNADLRGAIFDSTTSLVWIVLSDKKHGAALLSDVNWNGVNLAMIDWKSVEVLGDEPTASQKKTNKRGVEEDYLSYLSAVRANRQLAVVLREQGMNEDAARFAYRAQLMQRKLFWHQRKFGQYLFSLFLDLISGYGYKPIRSFITYIVVISAFAFTYFLLGPHLAWNEAIVISMTAFHGRGFFPEQFKPGDPQALIAALEAFVGLLIEVTFIATLTQRLFGK